MRLDLFSTPIWIREYPDMNITPVLNLCRELRDADPDGRIISNRNGWQSMDISTGFSELKELETCILQESVELLKQMGYTTDIFIENLWFNVNGENSINLPHIHDKCILSGVFYLSLGKDAGDLVFHRGHNENYILSQHRVNTLTKHTAATIAYPPVEKRLVLFPAWLPHSVESSGTNEPRISMAFNIKQK